MKITTIKWVLLVSVLACSVFFSYRWNRSDAVPKHLIGNWSFIAFYPKKSDTLVFKKAGLLSIDADKMVVGFTGCNKFRTECSIHGDSLFFGTILSGRKFCNRAYMDVEDRVKQTLQNTTIYKVSDSTLILYQGKTKLAALQKI
ncbi:META domain-containing protein [Cytophaga hutchinsonii]|uniref:DUF306 domain-containing protein n=1 Tax=Cytophaga hutchinsonii (strain ATCC 33406 / DSM 1761 / CIP 103989 / NBRC 15051 / NCIMB 9469 / D465) TaxID=269798 RepID=A0A6N4SUV7_CYTH3|nr:META domain-containing protein [Cytophaga hutchinsonii]ABG60105.1 conserved hypothetical protein [Cytophaga hutchinsonii ATCC 33406]SFX24062.1 META domain-containing protein [Cytophaga hutchinsonii ATCC 33406]